MIGAIVGDLVGSPYEGSPVKTEEFPLLTPASRFTDDTVLTVATAEAILEGIPFAAAYRRWGRRYPGAGYGGRFLAWLGAEVPRPYGSWGNGAAMRVAPVGWAFDDLATVLERARASAEPTHDHPDAVAGAQAVAGAVFLARAGAPKGEIREWVADRFGYDLGRTVEAIRPGYRFDVSAAGSVPEALVAFFDAGGFEDAVRKAVSLGGDADTQAAIAGAVAEAHWGGVPAPLGTEALARLPAEMVEVVERFCREFGVPRWADRGRRCKGGPPGPTKVT